MPVFRFLLLMLFWLFFYPAPQAAEEPLTVAQAGLMNLQRTLNGNSSGSGAAPVETAGQGKKQMFAQEQEVAEQRLQELRQRLERAPARIAEVDETLKKLQDEPEEDSKQLNGLTLDALEAKFNQSSELLRQKQQQLTRVNSELLDAYTVPERAQKEIGQLQDKLWKIDMQLKEMRQSTSTPVLQIMESLTAEQKALEAQFNLWREQLDANAVLQSLARSQRRLLMEEIRRLEQETVALQIEINQRRLLETTKAQAAQTRKAETLDAGGLAAQEQAINLRLTNDLVSATERLNELTQENLETRHLLDSMTQSSQVLEEQSKMMDSSWELSNLLYRARQTLPDVRPSNTLANEIADIRLYRFDLSRKQDDLRDPQRHIERLLARHPEGAQDETLRQDLMVLLTARLRLYEQLSKTYENLLAQAIGLHLVQTGLYTMSRHVRQKLDEQMFWIPSHSPLNMRWFRRAPQWLALQWDSINFSAIPVDLYRGMVTLPWLTLLVAISIFTLIFQRKKIKQKIQTLNDAVGRYRRDTVWHTPYVLLLNVLLVIPGSLLIMGIGLNLRFEGQGQAEYLGGALIQVSLAWLVFYTCWRTLLPGSICDKHFRWPQPIMKYMRGKIRGIGFTVIALLIVVTIAEHQPSALSGDVIGILTVLVCYSLIAFQLMRLLFFHPRDIQIPVWWMPLGLLLTMLPLGLFIAVCSGYYYTALKLSGRLIYTLYLMIFWLWFEATLVRGLAVEARRLMFKRLIAKHQADSGEAPAVEDMDVPVLDLEQVSQQSLRLIRFGLFMLALVGLYFIWADVLKQLGHLSNLVLYQYSSGSGENLAQVPITVLDVLKALAIIVISFMLAGNLPGLLEVTVLSRLKLAQGSAYATTTLLSYVIAGIGIVATLGALGLSWDKLQWLVAALSLGIGFGMQAIFANFVSGLILLFERPMRIGDIVSIDTVTGTVSRIRIRATHIIDFDRKTVVIPNQTFLVNQLINWTLTDAVTRIILTYQVALSCDPERIRQLLLQAAAENSRVMHDPGPTVLFMNYGPTTFSFELRMFVQEVDHRLKVTDEVNLRVNQLFRENGIHTAETRKLEIALAGSGGQERILEQRMVGGGDADMPPAPAY